MVGHFAGNNRLSKLSDHRELITKIAVESFEPFRQWNNGIAIGSR